MKLCLSVASYHRLFVSKQINDKQFIVKAKEHDIPAVELCDLSIESTEPGELRTLQHWLQEQGRELACIAVRNDFSLRDAEQRANMIAHVKRWIEVSARLETPLIRVWAGRSSATDDALERVIEGFRFLEPFARQHGVKMALENHGGVTLNPDQVVHIAQAVNSEYFGICPDFGHLLPDDKVEAMIKFAPYVKHVHAKTHAFQADGEEVDIPFGPILNVLQTTGYDGYVSIEYEGDDRHDEGVQQTKQLIHKHWN